MDAQRVLADADDRPPALCPRCGYDLVGEVMRWQGACPLDGRCSECGLELRWAEVLDREQRHPAWSYEGHGGAGRLVWTVCRGAVPCGLWRRGREGRYLGMGHAVDRQRLWVVLTVGVVLGLGVGAGALGWVRGSTGGWRSGVVAALGLAYGGMGTVLTMAAGLIFGESLARVRVRWEHFWRCATYSVIPGGLLGAVGAVVSHEGAQASADAWVLAGLGVAPTGMALWWWRAMADYVRVERPLPTAAAMVVVGYLAAFTAAFVTALRVG
ncbi:MAG: hypothetical protein IOD15_08950 [Phycisphaerales bacterium]|nr:hypothetical protein [Phycisphaerales bacterium]